MSVEASNPHSFIQDHVTSSGISIKPATVSLLQPIDALDDQIAELLNADRYELRYTSFEHRWYCNVFKDCKSWFNVNAFIIDIKSGNKVRLNAVETAIAIQDENTPISYEPTENIFYRHESNVTDFYIGCGQKSGHDPDYWGVAKCYFSDGTIQSWRFHSHA